MGQARVHRASLVSEHEHFKKRKNELITHFMGVDGFLEDSSEWLVIFREDMKKYSSQSWCRPILRIIKNWESFQDASCKVAFIWKDYNSTRSVPKLDQSRACLWPHSILNLQTFAYEVECDPDKRIIHAFLTQRPDCTLYKLIRKFKSSLVDYFCLRLGDKLQLKEEFFGDTNNSTECVDSIVLDFIRILLKILPKFFLNLPSGISDIESVVRNAVISDDLLSFLILTRKETFQSMQDSYMRGLESFSELSIECKILNKLEKDKNDNYLKAMQDLLELPSCRSIGQIHDSVAMLMNHVSMGLFDETNPAYTLNDEEIIQAFLLVVGRSSAPDLPCYVNILNRFLDNNTLDIKRIGQGITKLTFIVEHSTEWTSFITNC
jgi:hypothetical protein